MSPTEIEEAFRAWWHESYPMISPNSRTVETHVAFAVYALQMVETFKAYAEFDR